MLQDILNLEGVSVLTKEQQKHVSGGAGATADVCTAVCNEKNTSFKTSSCDHKALVCADSGGAKSCDCVEGPGPFDPPKIDPPHLDPGIH